LAAAGISDIIDFEYVPFGNAFYAIKECAHFQYPDTRFCWANATFAGKAGVFDGDLVCQHGPDECAANLMEMCVIKSYPDWKTYAPFLICYEAEVVGHGLKPGAAEKCAKQAGIDITAATACTKDKAASTALIHATARKTCALQPEHRFTPWVVLDGVACPGVPDGTGCKDLLQHVCKRYKGTLPAGCN